MDWTSERMVGRLQAMRAEFGKRTSHISPIAMFGTGQLIELVEELGMYEIAPHTVRRLIDIRLPRPEKDVRGYYMFSREMLGDVLIICKLHDEYNIPHFRNCGGAAGRGQEEHSRGHLQS